MLVSDILYSALRIAGLLRGAQRTASPEEMLDAFNALNSWIDELNTQRLAIFSIQQTDQPLAPGQQTYLVGPGGDWSMLRPSKIERANLVYLSDNPSAPLELPMEIMTLDGWKSIPLKSTQSVYPLQLYYDQGFNAAGQGTAYVFPVPQAINNVRLFVWQQLTQFASQGDTVILPPGYLKCIQHNLAKELAMGFPERAQISPLALQEADDSLEKIKLLNFEMTDLACDEALVNRPGGMWNWRTGSYQGRSY
jgi:hypothetical protein